ncbi:predicted protein [Nematostella vectensis]|uniref:Uncharacterized protein n=1 Tax=Nematostella vectensis TaxID=45351 RepID=A7S7A9_NEMVE|nr:uncharacterized protein LOC5512055 [Nematostella vectensis]EDO40360.1 predicted protein [Nematostella vectensis]|eukprot:XP_001632423.1 predicted protein [Nematostella vectensis]
MGAQESKKWHEMVPETPEMNREVSDVKDFDDPRSPTVYFDRTPIHLQDYENSPQNIELHTQQDPRSPTVCVARTPLPQTKQKDELDGKDEVFITRTRSNSEPTSPTTADKEDVSLSPEAPLTRKDRKCLLKQTKSPSDVKRKSKASRRQSVPQKLFNDSRVAPVTRSPLVARNFSEGSDLGYNAKSKKFTFVPKKGGFVYEDLCSGKENATSYSNPALSATPAINPLAVV